MQLTIKKLIGCISRILLMKQNNNNNNNIRNISNSLIRKAHQVSWKNFGRQVEHGIHVRQ